MLIETFSVIFKQCEHLRENRAISQTTSSRLLLGSQKSLLLPSKYCAFFQYPGVEMAMMLEKSFLQKYCRTYDLNFNIPQIADLKLHSLPTNPNGRHAREMGSNLMTLYNCKT